jgi:muconolactone delta-isomerase
MKSVFLAHLILPEFFSTNFMALIPKQRARINELMDQGVIKSYSLDMNRRNVWAFIEANDEEEVMEILQSFPIIHDVKIRIHELAFHDAARIGLPELIMN